LTAAPSSCTAWTRPGTCAGFTGLTCSPIYSGNGAFALQFLAGDRTWPGCICHEFAHDWRWFRGRKSQVFPNKARGRRLVNQASMEGGPPQTSVRGHSCDCIHFHVYERGVSPRPEWTRRKDPDGKLGHRDRTRRDRCGAGGGDQSRHPAPHTGTGPGRVRVREPCALPIRLPELGLHKKVICD
jgi:hypothetical protein